MKHIPNHIGKQWEQSAVICLESQRHKQGVTLLLRGSKSSEFTVMWCEVPDTDRRFYNDTNKTTENGAIGLATIIVDLETPYHVYSDYDPAEGGGFDYYLITKNAPIQSARLEVSGIRKGSRSTINRRVKSKLNQIKPSDQSGLAGYAIVVAFGKPVVEVHEK